MWLTHCNTGKSDALESSSSPPTGWASLPQVPREASVPRERTPLEDPHSSLTVGSLVQALCFTASVQGPAQGAPVLARDFQCCYGYNIKWWFQG